MYARSRHSTSDFDRSLRQQQIIKAVKDKLITQITSPTKVKQLYSDYTKIVKTNISLDEMFGLAQYMDNIKHMFSFGYTTECSIFAYKLSRPACFLYTPNRDLFG
jgi:anionic cell wall polymer biosynthesis LytR-Cps2A-Psr (LCP) family protein